MSNEGSLGGADGGALAIAREEARRTLDAQLATLDDLDAKAHSVFRLNVALVGLLVSVLSLAASTDLASADTFLNSITGSGIALFVLSAAIAGVAYTASGRLVGVSPAAFPPAREHSEREYTDRLLWSYAEWIRANERANERMALLVTLSLLGTVAGLLAIGVGLLAASTDAVLVPATVAVAFFLAVAVLTDLHGQLRRLFGDGESRSGTVVTESLDGPLAGQRIAKGRDRER